MNLSAIRYGVALILSLVLIYMGASCTWDSAWHGRVIIVVAVVFAVISVLRLVRALRRRD